MDIFYILVLILVSLLSAIYAYFKHAFNYWASKGVPYVEPSFPYGSVKGYGTTIHPGYFMQNIYHKFKSSTKFVGLYFFARPAMLIYDLDLIKHVLAIDFEYFTDRGFYYNKEDEPLSGNLFAVDGKEWRELRPKLTSSFSSGKLKYMFPTVVDIGHRLRDTLTKMVATDEVMEIKDVLARYTTDVIGTCAFGIECNSLDDPDAEFRQKGMITFEKPRHGYFGGALKQHFKSLARKLGVKNLHDHVSEFFLKVVFDTVAYREANDVHRHDFMELLIKMKNEDVIERRLTLNEIAANTFVFFMAGFETSSTMLTYCLYELAMNKDIQDKARAEVQASFKKHGGEFSYEMMAEMPYCDQVLKETLRKYPPLANLTRTVQKDYTIPDTDVVLEKGTIVWMPAFAIQRDPDVYPEPDKFIPERFAPENIKKLHSMAWLPFGEGPRNCIGLRFGQIQARVGLVSVLNHFEFTLSDKMESNAKFSPSLMILTAIGGIYLKVTPLAK